MTEQPQILSDAEVIAAFLAAADRRRRRLQLLRACAAGVVAGGGALALASVADRLLVIDEGWRWAYAAGVWGAAATAAWRGGLGSLLLSSGSEAIAGLAEARLPQLRDRLLAAHQLAGPGDGRDSPALRAHLRAEVAAELRPLRADTLLPMALVRRILLAAGLAIGAHGVLSLWPGLSWSELVTRAAVPWLDRDRVSSLRIRLLEPIASRSVVPAGDPVAVLAELSAAPAEGAWIEADGGRIALERRDDGRWAGQLAVGDKPLSFCVRAGDGLTAAHLLVPLPRPRPGPISLVITPPAYTGLPARTLAAERPEIEALVGSRIELAITPDQALTSAELILGLDGGASSIALAGTAGVHRGSFVLERSGTARLRLVAAASGFASAPGGDAEIRAIPDLVPTVLLSRPTGELVAPGDELLMLEGEADDDVGLATVGCEVRSNGGAWRLLDGIAPTRPGAWPLRERLDLLALGAVPGDRIEARLVAIDRKGSRAESATLAVTVATQGYPATRLAAAEALEGLTVLAGDAARRASLAVPTAEAWTKAEGDGRQEELAHDAALGAVRQVLGNTGSMVRSRLGGMRGGTADDLVLVGRAARRLTDRAVTGLRADASSRAGIAATGNSEFAACLAALSAAEAADVALGDLQRLDRDQDDARVLAASGGGERSRRRLAAAAVQAGMVGSMLERIAARVPTSAAAVTALMAGLTAACQDTAQIRAEGVFEGAYFAGRAFAQRRLVRADAQIRFSDQQPVMPGLAWQEISVRWLGQVKPPAPGTWTVFTRSDDGVRLWLGGKLVIDNWTDHGPAENTAAIVSDGSPIEVRLEYYQGGGGGLIEFDWQGPDGKRQPVAASGGGEQSAIAGFQQRLRALQRELIPLDASLLSAAADARRRLAILAGDEAADLAAPAATREAASAISARLADAATLAESRADADAQAVADLAQAAAVVATVKPQADTAALAADLAALAAEQRTEQTSEAIKRAQTAPSALAAAEELLRARPAADSVLAKTTAALLADAIAGREPDQATRDALAAARTAAENERKAASEQAAAARKRLGDTAPVLAERLSELAQESAAAATTTQETSGDLAAAMAAAHQLAERIEAVQRDLHRDANQHDNGDAADRKRARDADGAAALLAQPPPRAEELLQRAAAASDERTRKEAIAQAAAQQAALAADLDLAARHWRALAEGKDPEPTRAELRRREAETGVQAQLDAAAAERDQLAALAEANREQAQTGLAEALRDDPAMQRELSSLAEAAAQAAQEKAQAAAAQEQALADKARAEAEARAAQRQAATAAQGTLAEQARKLATAVREQAAKSDAAPQARPDLDAAAADLDRGAAAPDPAAAAQAAAKAATELDAAAAHMEEAAAPLQQAAQQRNAEAEACLLYTSPSPRD